MRIQPQKVDVVIIGAGPAGLAAAIAVQDAGCGVLLLERDDAPGGILQQCIHNGFGLHRFKEELTGPEYAQRFIDLVEQKGIPLQCNTTVLSITRDRLVTTVSPQKGVQCFQAGAIILAMGCRERPRGALMVPGTRPAGIFTAGSAQRLVNLEGVMPGKRVVILGSGDIGLIMARRMVFQGATVLACVELMPFSSGLKRNVVQCLEDYGIPLLLRHTVVDIHGKDHLEGVTLAEVDENRAPIPGTEQHLACDTLLLSVGLIPENELSVEAGIEISPVTSGAIVDETMQTSIPGIFACGNVLHVHDLVDFVSEEAETAGRSASRFVTAPSDLGLRMIVVKDGFGVRGCVPQRIRGIKEEGRVQFSFRPASIFTNVYWQIRAGDRVLLKRKSKILTPGQSVWAEVERSLLCDAEEIVVEVLAPNTKEEK